MLCSGLRSLAGSRAKSNKAGSPSGVAGCQRADLAGIQTPHLEAMNP